MKPLHRSFKITVALTFVAQLLQAQSSESDNNYLLYALVGAGVIALVYTIMSIADNMMQIEAKNLGVDRSKNDYSIFPNFSQLFKPKASTQADPDKLVALKAGHDIKLTGGASPDTNLVSQVSHFAIKPRNFRGMAPIPKVIPAVGDHVDAGDALMYDKNNPDIKYCAPVSGELLEIRRGAKRAITDLIIKSDSEVSFKSNEVPNLANASRQDLIDFLMTTGGWAHLNQRPFDMVPSPSVSPKNIFVSTFNTAPNAPNLNLIVDGNEAAFQKGLDTLTALTDGKVYLGLDARSGHTSHSAFVNASGVETNWFAGKHPAGNVGVQIHHTAPINTGEVVWTLHVQDVIVIGRLMMTGAYDTRTKIALTGSDSANGYIDTYLGAKVSELVSPHVTGQNLRIVAGDVLTGSALSADDFLNQKTDQITVMKEGDKHELFGWLLPLKPRPSVSPTFPTYIMPNHEFEVDTNTHGEKRAFVVTGAYEKVLPMDIYPMHLMKAIMANDFENMEGLGILELSEEDVALCEFVCPSKTPMQSILRDGLDMMRDQM